jgi:hypothetical protein
MPNHHYLGIVPLEVVLTVEKIPTTNYGESLDGKSQLDSLSFGM